MTNLMIMMPTGGHIDTPCVHTLLALTQALQKRGIMFTLRTYEWSDLVISRNYLMSVFLAKKEFSHGLLLDSDMSFDPELFFTLLDFDAEFAVAPYPQRRMPWAKFRAAIEREAAKPEDQRASSAALLAECLRYNVAQVYDAGEPWAIERRGDFRKVPGAGTGFMLIKRSVPEKLAASGAAQSVPGMNGPGYPEADFHDFFSHMRGRGGAIMHGEDTSFCRRWIKGCNGEIWAYEKARITHHGDLSYQGDYRYGDKPA